MSKNKEIIKTKEDPYTKVRTGLYHGPTRDRTRKVEWYHNKLKWAVTEFRVRSTGKLEWECDYQNPVPGEKPKYISVKVKNEDAKAKLDNSPDTEYFTVEHEPGYTRIQRTPPEYPF